MTTIKDKIIFLNGKLRYHMSKKQEDEALKIMSDIINRLSNNQHQQDVELKEFYMFALIDRINLNFKNEKYYDVVSDVESMKLILQEYNRDSMSNRLNLLEDMPLHVQSYRHETIQEGSMKMKDSKNSQDVYCYLFSDMFLITKDNKQNSSTNSLLSMINNYGQT
ncbi:unnamed protein product [Rotaria sordida]|uniref:Uncharacterized protein n=1 Tax=Rotaria sordida TaxID=392033 RepID=A0A815SKJ6_9BILA|nr:unnamed protein product [Rotaria sordida]